ncbi:hypothetical protein L6452_16987 [Arctium lappa]|uniref:Uncharacterized protein n=1 Tax=Arctium lappa TaxID=4217 RepID=A0ACB9C283_ARCLA|nr:hypothetical protein L6452_16987 [Arctium lappa]
MNEDEHHAEKKSVIKEVKEKAKKIKNSRIPSQSMDMVMAVMIIIIMTMMMKKWNKTQKSMVHPKISSTLVANSTRLALLVDSTIIELFICDSAIIGDLDLTYHMPGMEYIENGGFLKDIPLLEEVVVMEGAAHFINQEKPHEINNHIF